MPQSRSRIALLVVGGVAGLTAGLVLWACSGGPSAAQAPDPRIQEGLSLSPVTLNTSGKDMSQVGLGSYLINASGGCSDCHTNPAYAVGGNPYQGQPETINAAHYLAGGDAFGPSTCSRNLTPDTNGLPAGLTQAQFIAELQTGIDPGTGKLLQVMPWPVFGKMNSDDLAAIYVYLTAIPPAQPSANAACVPQ